MGKSSEEIKKMTKKETTKSPISPIWLGMRRAPAPSPLPPPPSPSTPPSLLSIEDAQG